MQRIKFTRKKLDSLPLPPPGSRVEYQDEDFPELLLRVTSTGQKTFCVRRKVAGRAVRVTLGSYWRPGDREPAMTVDQARRKAARARSQIVEGINPNAQKRMNSRAVMILRQVIEDYIACNKQLKQSTAQGYVGIVEEVAEDWMDRPLTFITGDLLLKRHTEHQVSLRSC